MNPSELTTRKYPGDASHDTERTPVDSEATTERRESGTDNVEVPVDIETLSSSLLEELDDEVEAATTKKDAQISDVKRRFPDAPPEMLAQLQADLDKNEAAMRAVVAQAESEIGAIIEEIEPEMTDDERAAYMNGILAELDADFATLSDEAKNDPEQLHKVYDAFQDRYSRSEEFQRHLAGIDDAERMRVMRMFNEHLAKAIDGVDENDRARVFLGMLEREPVDMKVDMLSRVSLGPDAKKAVLMNLVAGPDGPELLRQRPELFAELDKSDQAYALADRYPEAALAMAAELDDSGKFEVAEAVCEKSPEFAVELDKLGFSEVDKLAIGLRMVRRNPDAFFKYRKTSGITLTPEEEMAIAQDLIEAHPGWFPHAAAEFRLSSGKIAEVIGQYPESVQDSYLKALNIPGPEGMKIQEALAKLGLRGPETEDKESYEKGIAYLRSVERKMLLALEQAFPERATQERERARVESELHGDIKKIGDLASGSANSPLYVTYEGRALPAVYKPRRREHGFADGKEWMRQGIKPGDNAMREWLVYQIDKALQLDIVPTTIVRDGPEGFGSVQEWRVGEVAAKTDWQNQSNRAELQRLAFLDVLIDNSDRHSGNFLVSPDGEVQAIDNGYVFSEKPAADGLRSHPLEQFQGQQVGDDVRDRVDAFRGSVEVQRALWDAFQATFGYNSPKAVQMWHGFISRMEMLSPADQTKEGTYPAPTWH